MRQTKAGRIQRCQQFLLPLPPRFLWCNLTPRRAPASRRTEPVPDLSCTKQRLPLPLFSLSFLSSLCFLVSLNSWFQGPAMSSPLARVSAPLLECEGKSHGEAEVLGRSKATGLVCRNREERRCLSSEGEFQWRDIWGAWRAENKTGVTGVTGYGSCRGRATFDGSGGYGLEDAEYIYTLKYTPTRAASLKC